MNFANRDFPHSASLNDRDPLGGLMEPANFAYHPGHCVTSDTLWCMVL
jgi:hypothetical protein